MAVTRLLKSAAFQCSVFYGRMPFSKLTTALIRFSPLALTAPASLHAIDNNSGIKTARLHRLRRNGIWPSVVALLLVPVAFCNLLQCLCSLSHFNITVLLQFELQDKVLFHFVGLTYWIAHVSGYLLCFVLSMNYLEASKIENGLRDQSVPTLSPPLPPPHLPRSSPSPRCNLSQLFNLVC